MGAFGGGVDVAVGNGKGLGGVREGRRTIGFGKVGGASTGGGAKADEGRRTIFFGEVSGVFAAAAAATRGAKPEEGRSEVGNAGGTE